MELGATRFPITFFNSNILPSDEKKEKLTNFIELAILESQFSGMTHITNLTKMPHLLVYLSIHQVG